MIIVNCKMGFGLGFRMGIIGKKGKGQIVVFGLEVALMFFVFIILGVVVGIAIADIKAESFDLGGIEGRMIGSSLLYSCLVYEDEDGRSWPGIIDRGKLKEENVGCYKKEGVGYRVEFSLSNVGEKEGEEDGQDGREEILFSMMDEKQEINYEHCGVVKGFFCFEEEYFVLVKDEVGIKEGVMKVEVIKEEEKG